tara:strand:- start:813 stop:1043 length:231 start_codon:yes stop_codon:yes gene_type:complete
MIKIVKIVALFLMILMAIVSGYSLSEVDWGTKNIDRNIFRELKRPSMYLSLTIFYMIYYIRMLNKEKKNKSFKKSQ